MRPRVLLIAVAVLAATAPSASAATPFTVGASGLQARTAVSTDGTGHVAWLIPASGTLAGGIGYCRVPVGTSACAATKTIAFPKKTGELAAPLAGSLQLFAPSATTQVVVIATCTGCGAGGPTPRTYRWSSGDTGATFPAGPSQTLSQDAAHAPTGRAMYIDGGVGLVTPVQGSKVFAGTGTAAPVDGAPPGFGLSASVSYVTARDEMVFAASDGGSIATSLYKGDINNAGTVNTQSRWSAPAALPGAEPGAVEPSLTPTFGGLAILYRYGAPGDRHIGARTFNPNSGVFGAGHAVDRSEPVDDQADQPVAFGDDNGRVHAVWTSAYGGGRLRYARSDDGGAGFTAPGTIAAGEAFQDPDVAAGPDGQGLAVWRSGGPGSTIRAVRVDPSPEPPPLVTVHADPPGPPTAVAKRLPTRVTRSVTVLGGRLTLSLPRACVARGARFTATLSVTRPTAKSARLKGVRRIDFSLGGKRQKIDRRAPFTQKLLVPAKAKKGASLKVGVRAYVTVKTGHPTRASFSSPITVCR